MSDSAPRQRRALRPTFSALFALLGILLGIVVAPAVEPWVGFHLQSLRPTLSRDSGVSLILVRGAELNGPEVSLAAAVSRTLAQLEGAEPAAILLDVLFLSGGEVGETREALRASLADLSDRLIAPVILALGPNEARSAPLEARRGDLDALAARLPPAPPEALTLGSPILKRQRRLLPLGEGPYPTSSGGDASLPQRAQARVEGAGEDGIYGALLPHSSLAEAFYGAAWTVGYANIFPYAHTLPYRGAPSGGVTPYRFRPWLVSDLLGGGPRLIPSLGLAAAARALCPGSAPASACLTLSSEDALSIGGEALPTDSEGALLLSYRRRFLSGTGPLCEGAAGEAVGRDLELLYFLSGEDRLRTPGGCAVPPERLTGRVILLGDGLERETFHLPAFLGPDARPVTFHAQLIAQLLTRDFLYAPPPWVAVALGLLLGGLALWRRRWGHRPSARPPSWLPPGLELPGFFMSRALSQPEPLLLGGLYFAALGGMLLGGWLIPLTVPALTLLGSLGGFAIDLPIGLRRVALQSAVLLEEEAAARASLRRLADERWESLQQARERNAEAEARVAGIAESLAEAEVHASQLREHWDRSRDHAQGALEATSAELMEAKRRLEEERASRGSEIEALQAACQGLMERRGALEASLLRVEGEAEEVQRQARREQAALAARLEAERAQASGAQALLAAAGDTMRVFRSVLQSEASSDDGGGAPGDDALESQRSHLIEIQAALVQIQPEREEVEHFTTALSSLQDLLLERVQTRLAAQRRVETRVADTRPAVLPERPIGVWAAALGVDTYSPELEALCETIATRFAPTPWPVLILGETGVGKERVARGVHAHSLRKQGPFVPYSCTNLDDSNIADATLFGCKKGFLGPGHPGNVGLFEAAKGGSLLLDEIHHLSASTQAKLFRVLQEKVYHRVGEANLPVKADVRLIFAGQPTLRALVRAGAFSLDLYHRLGPFPLEIPPLRARGRDDVALLADRILRNIGVELGRDLRLSQGAMSLLQGPRWSGNVRALENVLRGASAVEVGDLVREGAVRATLERALDLSVEGDDGRGGEGHLPVGGAPRDVKEPVSSPPTPPALDTFGRQLLRVLRRNDFVLARVAADPESPSDVQQTLGRHARVLCARYLARADWSVDLAGRMMMGWEGDPNQTGRPPSLSPILRLIRRLKRQLQEETYDGVRRSLEDQYRGDAISLLSLLDAIRDGRIIQGL